MALMKIIVINPVIYCCNWNAILITLIATSSLWSTVQSTDTSATTPSEYVRPDDEDPSCLCKFPKHHSAGLIDRLKPLCGKRYSVEDSKYTYSVGICTTAVIQPPPGQVKAGALQTHKIASNDKSDSILHNMGSYEEAEVMMGNNWIILEYEGGDKFNSHCTNENRRTIIMIMCKEGETKGNVRWIEENNNKTGDCYYLFELDHMAACSVEPSSGLSVGSVVCLVIVVTVAVYLIGGFLFLRFVRGAKGLKQIPNYSFWRDFGALQADGCDLICRCGGGQQQGSKYYHGIGDHQIECAADGDEVDDHLLPM